MWLVENGKILGYHYVCEKCDFVTLNDRKWFCPNDDTRLKEILVR